MIGLLSLVPLGSVGSIVIQWELTAHSYGAE
jgi:hypothetical protein